MTNGKGEKALREIRSQARERSRASRTTPPGLSGRRGAAQLYVREFDLRGLEVSAGYNGKSAWRAIRATGCEP